MRRTQTPAFFRAVPVSSTFRRWMRGCGNCSICRPRAMAESCWSGTRPWRTSSTWWRSTRPGAAAKATIPPPRVIEIATGLQCAELQARLGPLELARRAADLAREYGTATLVVERNNHGAGVLAYLRSVCRYPEIHQQDGQDGWLTSSLSRPAMIGLLAAALVERPGIFQSRRLLKEGRTFVRLRNGKTGAQPGAHDDCVMAMAIALAARAEIAEKKEALARELKSG